MTETATDNVATATFRDVPGADDLWRASINDAGEFIFAMERAGMAEDEFFSDADFGRVDITVNFPGEVLTAPGAGAQQLDDDTVRGEFPFT